MALAKVRNMQNSRSSLNPLSFYVLGEGERVESDRMVPPVIKRTSCLCLAVCGISAECAALEMPVGIVTFEPVLVVLICACCVSRIWSTTKKDLGNGLSRSSCMGLQHVFYLGACLPCMVAMRWRR